MKLSVGLDLCRRAEKYLFLSPTPQTASSHPPSRWATETQTSYTSHTLSTPVTSVSTQPRRWATKRAYAVHLYPTQVSLNPPYRKQQVPHPRAQTPFDCCALSFQPFEHPVCARNNDGTGFVFDLVNIIPWLKQVSFSLLSRRFILHLLFQGNITTQTRSPKNLSSQTISSSSTTHGNRPEKSTTLFHSSLSASILISLQLQQLEMYFSPRASGVVRIFWRTKSLRGIHGNPYPVQILKQRC